MRNALPRHAAPRGVAHCSPHLLASLLLAGLLAGCACTPAHVGPYGGVHPGRCWVW